MTIVFEHDDDDDDDARAVVDDRIGVDQNVSGAPLRRYFRFNIPMCSSDCLIAACSLWCYHRATCEQNREAVFIKRCCEKCDTESRCGRMIYCGCFHNYSSRCNVLVVTFGFPGTKVKKMWETCEGEGDAVGCVCVVAMCLPVAHYHGLTVLM